MEEIPHFATVSYAFCNRFPPELSEEIFEHILNKALNNRMVEASMVFIDGTNIKAPANKKKYQKEEVARTAKVYEQQLRQEAAAEREKLGKKNDDDEPRGGSSSGTVSDGVAWDSVYDQITGRFPEAKFIVMDAGFKAPWIANKNGQRILTTHIWQEHLELADQLRKTLRGREIYAMRLV